MSTRGLIGAMVIVAIAVTSAPAQKEDVTEHVSVEMDAGLLTDYDDSGLWDGGYGAGVTGLWSLSASVSFCARFGLSHWSYAPEPVLEELVPPGAVVAVEQSSGQLQVLGLTPMVRWHRDEWMAWKLGAFAEGGIGVAYVKTFARTEVIYEGGGAGTQAETFEIDTSDVRAEVVLAAGLTRPVSSSSWLEVIPVYHAILADEVAHVFGVAIAFRARV